MSTLGKRTLHPDDSRVLRECLENNRAVVFVLAGFDKIIESLSNDSRPHQILRRRAIRYSLGVVASGVILPVVFLLALPTVLKLAFFSPAPDKLASPPAWRLRRAVRFLTTAKGFREVFEPTFADMDTEYFEALRRKEHFEAWKIVVACHLRVGMLLVTRPVVRALAAVLGWVKAGLGT